MVSNSPAILHANVEPSSHHRSHSFGSAQPLDLGRAQRRPLGFPDLELSQHAKGQAERQCVYYPGPYSQEGGPWVRQGEEDLPQH